MKELGNTKIIAVDLGYGNIKTANTLTPTTVEASREEPVFGGNILELDGMYYRIGEGHKEFIHNKETDQDFYILTLMAVARELHACGIKGGETEPVDINVHLVSGLPIQWVRAQREDHRAYLMQRNDVTYTFKKRMYHIHFVGCTIYPQGYPAIVNRLRDFQGINLLADIGNGTMNGLFINNKKPIESQCWSGKDGVYKCITKARDAVSTNFSTVDHDIVIDQILRTKTATAPKEYIEIVTNTAREYVADLFKILREHKYDPDFMNLYVVGGGGVLVKNFGEYNPENVTIIDDINELYT